MKNVYIPVNNQKIKGTLFYPEKILDKNPAVLFIHGWATGEKSYLKRAPAVAQLGYVCLTINLRGHGESDGKLDEFSRADHLEDAVTAYDFLTQIPEVDVTKVSAVGSSYGGYLATLLSAKRNLSSLVLRVTALYPDDKFTTPTAKLIEENAHIFQQHDLSKDTNMALRAAAEFNKPLLFIESENDTVVPKETTKNYLDVINPQILTHKIMRKADHILSTEEWKKEFIEILVEWFREK